MQAAEQKQLTGGKVTGTGTEVMTMIMNTTTVVIRIGDHALPCCNPGTLHAPLLLTATVPALHGLGRPYGL